MSKTGSWKKMVSAVIKIAISVLILSYLFNEARQDNQFAEMMKRPKNWTWLFVAFQLVILAHFVSFVRWRLLVRALDIPFSTLDAIRIGLIGIFFGLFAFGVVGGDTLRIYYAARDAKSKIPEVVCSVVLDRAIGMLVMFTFASVGFLFIELNVENAQNPEQMKAIEYACTLIGIATASGWMFATLFLFSPRLLKTWPLSQVTKIPKIGGIFQQLVDAILLYRQRMDCIASCIGWSAVVNACLIAAIFLTAVGINVEHPPFEKHFIIAPFSMTANAIPLPGGVGGMEFVLSYFYDAMSSDTATTKFGIVVAFTFRIWLLMVAAMGAVAWFLSRKQIEELEPAMAQA